MVEKKDLDRIHIVLDASKAHRCTWCGSPQSNKWITDPSGVYCSTECVRAASSKQLRTMVALTCCYTILAVLMFAIGNPIVVAVSLGSLFILYGIIGKLFLDTRFAQAIPEGSRSQIGVSEVSLLQRISNPVECPNCDGNIDLSKVDVDMIYTCQYCGATGVLDIKLLK